MFDSNESGIQLGKFKGFDKGLIIVAPIEDSKSSAWVFLRPFTVEMCVTTYSHRMCNCF